MYMWNLFPEYKEGGLEVESENEKIPINDLEMAKKRTNKIMITDMAIEKVPLITPLYKFL